MSADGEDEVTAARGENHEGHSQIDQSRFSDIGRDELGGGLDGGKEKREIARRGGTEAELVREDMAGEQRGRWGVMSMSARGSNDDRVGRRTE